MQTSLPGQSVASIKGWICSADALRHLIVDTQLASFFCDYAVRKARSQERRDGSRGGGSSLAGWAAVGLFVKEILRALRGLCAALTEARTHGWYVRGA